ncbi:MAG TPA: class I SAM-dependent methyltransferase [Terriglobales bacterium]|nr:class I SAM-dependent methyltransferase [Terriglobales bacterium]
MAYVDFVSTLHQRTQRDYLARVNEFPKEQASEIARRFDRDYWDGDRRFGYGGYSYDGRWRKVADALREHYQLESGDRVLDVGCGKGFLLYDLTQSVPGLEVAGIDVSRYAVEHSKPEIRDRLQLGTAAQLPYEDDSFDLVLSINTLHNLRCYDLERALSEIERVGRGDKYICVESFRSELERVNLFYWQLTCESLYAPEEWDWWFARTGYSGDHSFIFFE